MKFSRAAPAPTFHPFLDVCIEMKVLTQSRHSVSHGERRDAPGLFPLRFLCHSAGISVVKIATAAENKIAV